MIAARKKNPKMKILSPFKPCRKCHGDKPLSDFYVHKEMRDGHLNFCKECVKARMRKFRREQPDHQSKVDRTAYHNKREKEGFRESRTAYERKWRSPEKDRCHNFVKRHLRSKRPALCTKCKKRATEHGHHPDYKNPAKVKWLCVRCHASLRCLNETSPF